MLTNTQFLCAGNCAGKPQSNLSCRCSLFLFYIHGNRLREYILTSISELLSGTGVNACHLNPGAELLTPMKMYSIEVFRFLEQFSNIK